MKNEIFPSYQSLREYMKYFMRNSKNNFLNDDNCEINLLGSLVDAGYDVLKNVSVEDDFAFTLMVRVSEGYLPIQLIIDPRNMEAIKDALDRFYSTIRQYKDIPLGYFMVLIPTNNVNIQLDEKAKYNVNNNENMYWWGGRIFNSNENIEKTIFPVWQKSKLALYHIRKENQ